MANVLVTGGAGFIGSHLVAGLTERGHAVRVLDNFSTGRRQNLSDFVKRIDLREGDLREPEHCLAACDDIEFVFHEAALPSVPISVERPREAHDSNIQGTFNLLLAARDKKCRRLIYAGSSSAYGDSPVSPKHEDLPPAPKSPYAVQKLAGEHYCRAFYECWGLETLTIRYFNVFGARQDPKSQYAAAIPAFVTAILSDSPPTIYGDGEQSRDFTYVDNIVHGNLLAMAAPRTAGEVVNVACGGSVTINQVVARINELLGKRVRPDYAPARAGDVRHSEADIRRAKTLLGYVPRVGFDEGLKRAIDYYAALARR